MLTNAGGPGILAADALESAGLKLVELSETTVAALKPILPAEASIRNPLDMVASATPASYASSQRPAQRHQRSPGRSPGNPKSGCGVERSLPTDLENARNSSVITAQTVCTPTSSPPVLQQPSR
mgnify:CR=1 FL=1